MNYYQQIIKQVAIEGAHGFKNGFPSAMTMTDKKRYIELETETRINDHYKINQEYNDRLKDIKFDLIAKHITY